MLQIFRPCCLCVLALLAESAMAHPWHDTAPVSASVAAARAELLAQWTLEQRALAKSAGGVGSAPTEQIRAAAAAPTGNAALMAASFGPFKPKVRFYWDSTGFYEESDGLPDRALLPNLMVGITSWQQQIPLPTSYFAATINPERDTGSIGFGKPNVWKLPLVPVPSVAPISLSGGNFQRGAVGLAANGIPIFNPRNNRGEFSQAIGELDQYGGHCGLADDYHYHIAPVYLQSVLGVGTPVAWALDGYPIYGYVEPDGSTRLALDADGGHDIGNGWGYHYHAIGSAAAGPQSPYLMNAFHGTVVNYGGQVDGQPEVQGIRASGTGGYTAQPVNGATITAFKNPVALATDTAGNLVESTVGAASPDQYLMRYTAAGTTYDLCWWINRSVNPKTLTITWRLPAGVTTTTTTYPNANNRLTTYPMAGPSLRQLPDTGQTLVATTAFGEDSDYTINPPSFADNGDGTITDNVTGLMWQKTDNGESTWDNAVARAASVATGGYTDWRLPTPSELFSLMNHNNGNPAAIDLKYFPSNPAGAAEYWWSSDLYGTDATHVWSVNSGGGLGPKPKSETISAGGTLRYHARYVRGAKPTNGHNYVNNGDGTVTDSDTGLMWAQVPGPAVNWTSALTYAENLTLAGFSDWRLPNIKELQSLTDYTLATATTAASAVAPVNRVLFPAATTPATAYWSSTVLRGTGAAAPTSAWLEEFGVNNTVPAANGPTRNGQGLISYETMTSRYPAFAVRGPVAAATLGPAIITPPQSQAVTLGGNIAFTVVASGSPPPAVQWLRNGTALAGASSQTLTLNGIQPFNTGLYAAVATSGASVFTSDPAILGLVTTDKVTGAGTEIAHGVFVASNGNTFDQVLLSGAAATVTAEPGKITRTSFVDLTNDIVQVEFSGAGSLSIVLDNPSGPALPVNYNQATTYMKGHAGIVIAGANETTNVSVFSVGRITAVNQTLFRSAVTYDGMADLAFIAILSPNGKFGGLRTANANYYATKGLTGVYAPGVAFTGPVYVGNLSAYDTASPVLVIGSSPDTQINGGDLFQANGKPVQVGGLTQLKFVPGIDSNGTPLTAKANRAQFLQNGVDVTKQIVSAPASSLTVGAAITGPSVPTYLDNVWVTARVTAATGTSIAQVRLTYSVATPNASPAVILPMLDDGLHGDGAAGDGVYGVAIPAQVAGATVNYSVTVTDNAGASAASATAAFVVNSTLTDATFSASEFLGMPTQQAVTLSLEATTDLQVYVEYGPAPGNYTGQTPVVTYPTGTPFTVQIQSADPQSPLQPNHRYFYRVRYRAPGEAVFKSRGERSFQTQRPKGQPFTFTLTADPHLDEVTSASLFAVAMRNVGLDTPDFHVDLGDIIMSDKLSTIIPGLSINYGLVEYRAVTLRNLFGAFAHSVPFFGTIGNHEGEYGYTFNADTTATKDNNIATWDLRARKLYFPTPVADSFYTASADSKVILGKTEPLEDYYAWEWGDALFVVLDPYWNTLSNPNSTPADNWRWSLGKPQYDWLKQTLQASSARYKFVFIHHLVGGVASARGGVETAQRYEWGGQNLDGTPGFAAQRPGWDMPIHQLLLANHVSAVFHGHDHFYDYQQLDGIIYQECPQPGTPSFTTGSQTDGQYVTGTILPNSGHLRITVSPSNTKVEYVRAALPTQETATLHNRDVAHSYTIAPIN